MLQHRSAVPAEVSGVAQMSVRFSQGDFLAAALARGKSLFEASLLATILTRPLACSFGQGLRESTWPLFGGKSLLEASLLARSFRGKPVSDTRSPARALAGDPCLQDRDLFGKKQCRSSRGLRGRGNRDKVVPTLCELKVSV